MLGCFFGFLQIAVWWAALDVSHRDLCGARQMVGSHGNDKLIAIVAPRWDRNVPNDFGRMGPSLYAFSRFY